jgi:hypothetical protein
MEEVLLDYVDEKNLIYIITDYVKEIERGDLYNLRNKYMKNMKFFMKKKYYNYNKKIIWRYISIYEDLSEKFMEEFGKKLDWVALSMNQRMSEQFMEENLYRIDLQKIFRYHNVSDDFFEKYVHMVIYKEFHEDVRKYPLKYINQIKNERNIKFFEVNKFSPL